MKVAICSIFRDSVPYIDRYFQQINALRGQLDSYHNMAHGKSDIHLVLAEGDSVDHTWMELASYTKEGDILIQTPHGGPHFGSVDNPQRWDQIAHVVQSVLPLALGIHPDVVVWVESDLLWDFRVLKQLIETAAEGKACAPMVFAEGTERFYDIWGYRMAGGKKFTAHTPYFPKEPERVDGLVRIESCGSCFATSDKASLRQWSGHWPFAPPGGLWLNPLVAVRHP